MLWRGARKRCPQCGEGRIYEGWVKLHEHCPHCGLKLLADQGDLWAYLVALDRALFIFPIIVMIYFRLTLDDPFWFYLVGSVIGLLFVFTLPHRNGMSLGVDYLLRRRHGDLAKPQSHSKSTDTDAR